MVHLKLSNAISNATTANNTAKTVTLQKLYTNFTQLSTDIIINAA